MLKNLRQKKILVGAIALGILLLVFAMTLAPSSKLSGNLHNTRPAAEEVIIPTPARCYDVATAYRNGVTIPGEAEACEQNYPHIWRGVINPPSYTACSAYAAWYQQGRLTDMLHNNQSQWDEVSACRVAYPELGL